MMNSILNYEQLRLIVVGAMSSLLAIITPTKGFIVALILMAGFNIWAGMRADGVVIMTCKNFDKKKFRGALWELLLYTAIILLVRAVMWLCGDDSESMYAVKTLVYIFLYVYLQHSFRNLTIAYPTNMTLWIIYLFIRLEFVKMLPSNLKPLLEQYDKHIKAQGNESK